MTDFRALCAELVDAIGSLVGGVQCGHYNQRDMWKCREIFNRAYAALAQPEPQGTKLIYRYNPATIAECGGPCEQGPQYCDCGQIKGEPEPQGPTDEEIEREALKNADSDDEYRAFKSGAFFVQERISRPAIEPVPVSERLPGLEDCAPWPDESDANHWCWLGRIACGGWDWSQASALGMSVKQMERSLAGGGWTHWLPHWALPVPKSEASQ